MVSTTSARTWSNTVGDIESTFWSENCPLVVHSQGDDIRQVAVAYESCDESILPAAVVKFFDECENMRKLEARQHHCHY